MEEVYRILGKQILGGRGGPVTYVVSFPQVLKTARCPMAVYQTVEHSAAQLRKKIMYIKISLG